MMSRACSSYRNTNSKSDGHESPPKKKIAARKSSIGSRKFFSSPLLDSNRSVSKPKFDDRDQRSIFWLTRTVECRAFGQQTRRKALDEGGGDA